MIGIYIIWKLRLITIDIAFVDHLFTANTIMEGAHTGMVRALPKLFTADHRPKVVIAIDGIQTLALNEENGFKPSTVLCRAISAYSCLPFMIHSVWVVFASTFSKIADLPAARIVCMFSFLNFRHPLFSLSLTDDSARVARGGHLWFPPYTLLGWDQNAFPGGSISADDTANLRRVVSFGRPL